jgi:hypothetical protein
MSEKISPNYELKSAQMYSYWPLKTVIGHVSDSYWTRLTPPLNYLLFLSNTKILPNKNLQPTKSEVSWVHTLMWKFSSVLHACTVHLYRCHNRHHFIQPCHFFCTVVCILFFAAAVTKKSVTIFRNWNVLLVVFWYA